jgi:hypothetical protein
VVVVDDLVEIFQPVLLVLVEQFCLLNGPLHVAFDRFIEELLGLDLLLKQVANEEDPLFDRSTPHQGQIELLLSHLDQLFVVLFQFGGVLPRTIQLLGQVKYGNLIIVQLAFQSHSRCLFPFHLLFHLRKFTAAFLQFG